MTLSSPSLRRFVKRALVDAAGRTLPDHTQLASAFDTLCRRLRERLHPLFGTTAVNALFARALHVAAAEFPWLSELLPRDQDVCSMDRIANLGRLDVPVLAEGLAAVLAHNIGLLNAFVGEDFVLPLVQQAWGIVDAPGTEGVQ